MAFDFILPDYFRINLSLSDTGTSTAEGLSLQEHIDKYTPVYLETILGYRLAARVIAVMDLYDPQNPTDTAVEYRRLVFGNTYSHESDEQTYKWEGLTTHLDTDGVISGKLISPIANFVYCLKLRHNASTTVGNGQVIPKYENGMTLSSYNKIVDAWNEMVDYNIHLHNYIDANATDYADYDYIGIQYPPALSMYNNLAPNQQLFRKLNKLGI